MATHSSILVWRIPRTEETGGVLSMQLQRVGRALVTEHTHIPCYLYNVTSELS